MQKQGLVVLLVLVVAGGVGWYFFDMDKFVMRETKCEPSAHAAATTGVSAKYNFKFYIYEELNNANPTNVSFYKARCHFNCQNYCCVTKQLYDLAKNHPARTLKQDEADFYIIPFSVVASYYGGSCEGLHHESRMEKLLKFLFKQKSYKKKKGLDHYWDNMFWMFGRKDFGFFPAELLIGNQALSKMIFGRYQTQLGRVWPTKFTTNLTQFKDWGYIRASGEYTENLGYDLWRARAVLTPIRSSSFSSDITYEDWLKRPKMFHFRGTVRDCYTQEQRDFLEFVVSKFVGNSTFGRGYNPGGFPAYVAELKDHKFCFVVKCDELETSRFIDSLAENCIPITISDGWRQHTAIYGNVLNYDTFTFNLGQAQLYGDPKGLIQWIVSQPDFVYRNMFKELQKARRQLLWYHPQSLALEPLLQNIYERSQDTVFERPLLKNWAMVGDEAYNTDFKDYNPVRILLRKEESEKKTN